MLKEILKNINEKVNIERKYNMKLISSDDDGWTYAKRVAKRRICGFGELQMHLKKGNDKPITLIELDKNEEYKEDEVQKEKGERLLRYATSTTVAGGMMILCLVNADKGYIKYPENLDDIEDLEDIEWSKPFYFEYLKVNY